MYSNAEKWVVKPSLYKKGFPGSFMQTQSYYHTTAKMGVCEGMERGKALLSESVYCEVVNQMQSYVYRIYQVSKAGFTR